MFVSKQYLYKKNKKYCYVQFTFSVSMKLHYILQLQLRVSLANFSVLNIGSGVFMCSLF